jgi:alpha-tubulin suppressor-like RCC1 family protein
VLVRSLSSIVRAWAGGNRALALKSDGTLYLWSPSGSESAGVSRPHGANLGSNSFGSLGTGGGTDVVAPRGVLVRSLSSIVRVWAGGNRALALKSDGTLYLWGPSGSEKRRCVPRADGDRDV